MLEAVSVYVRGALKSSVLPSAIGISGRAEALERLKRLIGAEAFEEVSRASEEVLRGEARRALTTDDLVHEFPSLAEKFWARLWLPLVEMSAKLYTLDAERLNEVKACEEELAEAVAMSLRASNYANAEDLVYALSALVDRDTWILEWISRLEIDEFVEKLSTRALSEVLQLSGYTIYLAFAWFASTVAVLGLAKEYRGENRDLLAAWSRQYAKEVQELLDALDLLIDDETYEDVLKLGILKE